MTRLGVDIGGTFTDAVFHEADGSVRTAKASTTPADITQGVMAAIEKVGVSTPDLDAFLHGTTVALNALLEGKTPTVGLVTTRGFRDVLEIMRTNRPDMYNLQQQKPAPLVARRWRYEIGGRMNHLGETVEPVDAEEVRSIAAQLMAEEIETVAVCLLHAYANPEHERAVELALSDNGSHLEISVSSEISSLSARVRAHVDYRDQRSHQADRLALPRESGALARRGGLHRQGDDHAVQRRPHVGLGRSPPPCRDADVRPGRRGRRRRALARRGEEVLDLVTLDIGGTSADAAIVDKGDPVTRTVGHVGRWPVMVPMVDIEAIGAGGGSIARVDEFGALSVGPQSAGAVPGPVSYGKGGTEPTVTDANLLLGRINPDNFLGGALKLDVEGARAAMQDRIARRLLDVVGAGGRGRDHCRELQHGPLPARGRDREGAMTRGTSRCSPTAAPVRCTPATWRQRSR